MDIIFGAAEDGGHLAKLEPLLFCGNYVENRRRDRGQRFPDGDSQWKGKEGGKEKKHTSHQLEVVFMNNALDAYFNNDLSMKYSSAQKTNTIDLNKYIADLKKPGKKTYPG